MKNNTIYPLMHINNKTIVASLKTKSVAALGGSDLLSFNIISDCEIFLFFIKI